MQTYSPISQKAVVLLVGSRSECPPGCERVRGTEEVKEGAFFVEFKPSTDGGRWAYEASPRPWCVLVKRGKAATVRGSFGTVEMAVKRARRLNERMAS